MHVLKLAAMILAATAAGASAQTSAPPVKPTPEQIATGKALIAANSRTFSFAGGRLSGPGGDLLRKEMSKSQFVLLAESHFDHDTPKFAGALFNALRADYGFNHLVLEVDPIAVDQINAPQRRGRLDRIVELVKRHPNLVGFAGDQDLELYADVSREGPNVLWGIEQIQGPEYHLRELVALAPNARVRAETERLLAIAAKEDRTSFGELLHNEPRSLEWLSALQRSFNARPGSRADILLTNLVKSAEIFGYNRRGLAGEPVGLLNNTVREALFKKHFLEKYRASARSARLPKAMFKMGDTHMYRGKSPVHAYTIGNLAHEFAIVNGMEAYGIMVVPVGDQPAKLNGFPAWISTILPTQSIKEPTIIDLRPIKPSYFIYARQVDPIDQWRVRDMILAYDAIVLLPNGKPQTFKLTGFPR